MINLYSFNGRLNRHQFAWITVGFIAIAWPIGAGLARIFEYFETKPGGVWFVSIVLGGAAALFLGLQVVKRLHDLGWPGWQYAYFIIPVYNLYFLFVLLTQAGQEGENQYGPNPDEEPLLADPDVGTTFSILAGLAFLFLLMIFPIVGPAGERIYYLRHTMDALKDRRRANLWTIGADGSGHRPLTTGPRSLSSPALAPDGTAARPIVPSSSTTSTSTVGLPRLSRISRAWMSMIVLMGLAS